MPRKKHRYQAKQAEQADKQPDDMKEPQRNAAVGSRSSEEYEDIEASRMRAKHSSTEREAEAEELSEDDIIDEIDLDAAPEGEGPDA
jgi:hypothetical protein